MMPFFSVVSATTKHFTSHTAFGVHHMMHESHSDSETVPAAPSLITSMIDDGNGSNCVNYEKLKSHKNM